VFKLFILFFGKNLFQFYISFISKALEGCRIRTASRTHLFAEFVKTFIVFGKYFKGRFFLIFIKRKWSFYFFNGSLGSFFSRHLLTSGSTRSGLSKSKAESGEYKDERKNRS